MAVSSKPSKKSAGLSDDAKKKIAIGAGSVLVIVVGWWAYFQFTTVAPPDLKQPDASAKVAPEKVAEFLGDARGFGRMNVTKQEDFLLTAYRTYGQNPETRARFIQSLHQMSASQREVLNNGVFEIGRKHVMEQAKEFASIPSAGRRSEYIGKAYDKFEKMRAELGGANPGDSLSEPMKQDVPSSSDEMMKVLVDRTDASERSQAKPFVDAMAAEHKAREAQKNKNR